MLDSIAIQTTTEAANVWILIYVVLLAFLLSTLLAWVYQKTFRGLSFSRNYVQAIVLISIISATVIQSVGDSLARGIGIMAAMAIIRFRTNFKDPRDTLFLFASLAAGIACGAFAFAAAIIGTISFSLAAVLLYYSPLGPSSHYDGMLRFNMASDGSDQQVLEEILRRYCKAFSLITLRDIQQGERLDYAYHVKLRPRKRHDELLHALQQVGSVAGIQLMMQEATVDL
ncbi:MAG: DUF4956 domain-containing protein [Pseudomonadota bacterium]